MGGRLKAYSCVQGGMGVSSKAYVLSCNIFSFDFWNKRVNFTLYLSLSVKSTVFSSHHTYRSSVIMTIILVFENSFLCTLVQGGKGCPCKSVQVRTGERGSKKWCYWAYVLYGSPRTLILQHFITRNSRSALPLLSL